jgi:hypothetical protein
MTAVRAGHGGCGVARKLQFTVNQEPIQLEIGGEQFVAPPVLSAAALGDLLDQYSTMQTVIANVNAQVEAGERGLIDTVLRIVARPPTCPTCHIDLTDNGAMHPATPGADEPSLVCPVSGQMYRPDPGIFDTILPDPVQAQRFRLRLYSRTQPLDLTREVYPAITALIEEYTGRPTQPSPPSPTPSGGDGHVSTDGAQPTGSTPAVLTPAGS